MMNIKTPGNTDSSISMADKLKEMYEASKKAAKSAGNEAIAGKQQLLSGLIKRVEMMDSMMYTGKSWNKLMRAYGKAKRLSMGENPSLKNLNRAIAELTAALAALENAEMAKTAKKAQEQQEDESREPLPLIMELGQGGAGGEAAASAGASAAGSASAASAEGAGGSLDVSV